MGHACGHSNTDGPFVLGVDGWRGGWIGALVDADGQVEWRLLADAAAVVAADAAMTAIDIPIGLTEDGVRRCDLEARGLLGAARSSVFLAPTRPVLTCATYAEAREALRQRGVASMSAQAFGIVAKVREVDAAMTPELQERVVEVHPELAFRRLGGTDRMASKKTAAGVGERVAALRRWLPDVDAALSRAPVPVPVDDALDALACAWAADRMLAGHIERLGDGARDSRGLLMQIVVPSPVSSTAG
jgi:predicted RNase H-like nuclease